MALATLGVKLSRVPIPSRALRRRLFRDLYARMYPPGLDEQDADRPIGDYPSFNALFTRGIRPDRRPISEDPADLLSPCDGTVQDVSRIEAGQLLTVKGINYSLSSLLAAEDVRLFEGGRFAIIFLSPIDCHRVFSPADGTLDEVVHVPGARLLVHPTHQKPAFPVYTLNERVIFRLSTTAGPCAVVMVAGWGVGHVTTPLAPDFRPGSKRVESFRWPAPPMLKRGAWLATFELGSTVVIVTPPEPAMTPVVSPNEKVRYGQPVFRLADVAGRE